MTLDFSSLGGVIFRYKYLLFIFLIFVSTFFIIGLFVGLGEGAWWGVGVAFFFIGVFLHWGEKLILVFSKARYVTDDELLINQVKNFCCHLNVREVKVYWSNTFVNNVYYADAFLGRPVLIIGKNIYHQFTKNELNSLIYASLLRIKSGEAKNRTLISLLFLALYSPFYIGRSFFKPSRIRRGLDVFFYPAFGLKEAIYENEREVMSFDAEVGAMQGLRKDYVSALFKVSRLPSFYESSIGALVTAELSHARNSSDDVINNILFATVDIKKRMKALNS